MSDQDPKYDVNFDHNPLGPLPREDTIVPPKIKTRETGSRQTKKSQIDRAVEIQPSGPRLGNAYDFDNNFLGNPPEGYPAGAGDASTSDPSPNPPFNLAETDEDTQDAITRLFSSNLDKGDEEQINLELDPVLADQPEQSGTSETGKTSQKRKGSSRINMLTRGGACEFCKRRKLKCSAELPSCSACERAGKVCVYSQKKQKSRVRTLEDRLAELERKLDPDQPTSGGSNEVTPSQGVAQEDASINFALAEGTNGSGPWGTGVDWSFLGLGEQPTLPEPDLMTLADAAAADGTKAITTGSWPWDGMDEQTLATEIVKAVEGEKDIIGERIIGHLLSLYNKATEEPYLHLSLSPSALLRRLSTSSPPHPSLLLSVLPLLLHLSPSATLSNQKTIEHISKRLETPARLHGLRAFAACDTRLVDVMIGVITRSYEFFEKARLVEGWTEHSSAVGLIWMTGIAKLGGIDQLLGGTSRNEPQDVALVEKDEKMRELRFRGVLSHAPTTVQEAGDLITFFWVVYTTNLCASKAWNVPALIDEDQITTPFPQASYDSVDALRGHPQTISHFLSGKANTGSTDTCFCASVKGLCLLYRATRLFDMPPSKSTPETTAVLQKISNDYMVTLTPLDRASDREDFMRLSEAWMTLHAALMYLHLKAEIDATESGHQTNENTDKALEEGAKVAKCIEVLSKRDKDLGGVALLAVTTWTTVGRTIFKLAQRLDGQGPDHAAQANKARVIGWKMVDANVVVGKRMPHAQLMSQLLKDVSDGIDGKGGEFPRKHFAL